MQIRGGGKRKVDPTVQQSIQEPTKEGKRKRKVHPAMNSSSRDTPGGKKKKRKRKRRRRGEDEKTNDAPSYAPRIQGHASQEGGETGLQPRCMNW